MEASVKARIEQIRERRIAASEIAQKSGRLNPASWSEIDFLLSLVKSQEATTGLVGKQCNCHRFIHLHDGNCDVHGLVHKQEMPPLEWEYCPTCAGELDTGYECTKCGRDWQSYVHDAALRIETETEQ